MEPKDRRKVDDFILYAWPPPNRPCAIRLGSPNEEDRERTGVMIGSGIGGLNSIAETAVLIKERGRNGFALLHSGALINLVSGQVSIRFGFRGRTTRGHRLFDRRPCHQAMRRG